MISRIQALVIDDDDVDRLLIKRSLRADRNIMLRMAASIDEGVETCRKRQVDVILLDLGLVETTGLETLEQLRELIPNIPVVVLTGMPDDVLGLQAIELGAQDYVEKSHLNDGWISRCLRYAIQRHQLQLQLKDQALTDGLTRLRNRKFFEKTLLDKFSLVSSRDADGFAVGFIDLDDFKLVNDCFGHEAGDLVLCEFARRLNALVRSNDVTARFGGDEFVVLLDGLHADDELEAFSRRLDAAMVEPMRFEGRDYHLSASIGYAICDATCQDPRDVLRDADTAMYRAKRDGASLGRKFCASMRDDAFESVDLKSQLHKALDRDEFELAYQPIVNLTTGDIENFEALLRWPHPEHGLIPPLKFIPYAERTGLIVPIGRRVLQTACQSLASWQAITGNTELRMSVNVSTVQIASGRLLDDVRNAVRESGIEASCLDLEVTESTIMKDHKYALGVLGTLREIGVRVSIDDFGTGYSSLAQLHRFKFDTLKIDRVFVREMLQEGYADLLVQTILMLARSMEISVIAEGIESGAEVDRLTQLGCTLGQGYLFGKPLPKEETTLLLVETSEQIAASC